MKPIEWVILIVLAIGIIVLQIFLSKKENKWLGLILPLAAFCAALFFMVVTPVYMVGSDQTVTEQTVTVSGDVVENVITHVPGQSAPDTFSVILTGIYLFALYNIPTAVLLIIYAVCRVKRKKNVELEKMNIQDLH